MDLNPKELGKADYERWQRLTMHSPATPEQWRNIAEFVLDAVGLSGIVQFGDIRLWRHAIAERSDTSLPPLNLPLSIWEGYLANPYSNPSFHFADGTTKEVLSWDNVFYSWHSRAIVLFTGTDFTDHWAEKVVGITCAAPAPSHITVLERLQWFKKSEPFLPISVRVRSGNAYMLDDARHFTADPSGSILAIGRPSGTKLIKTEEIQSVRSLRDMEAITKELVEAQKATPFRPYRIKLCNDSQFTVDRPERIIVTAKRLFLAEGQEGNHGFEKVREIGIEYLDAIELMPCDSK